MLMHGFDPLMVEDRYLTFLLLVLHLAHLHYVTATVPRIFNITYIYGFESILQTFNGFATESR